VTGVQTCALPISIMFLHSIDGLLSTMKHTSSYYFGASSLASGSKQISGLAPMGYPSR